MRKTTYLIGPVLFFLAACGDTKGAESSAEAASPAQASAQDSGPMGCSRLYPSGQSPAISNEKLQAKGRTLCRRFFAIGYSGVAKQPIWVAEQLTETTVKMARQLPREGDFLEDQEIPDAERARLSDYRGSGFDRGHMAPDADMPTRAAANEALLLTNIIPQAPGLNRKSWADLEESVRRQTRGGPVYVVTGPLFEGANLRTTKKDSKVLVPTSIWKAIYAKDRGATVFIATNQDRPRWTTMSIEQFTRVHQVDPFPGLDEKYRKLNGILAGTLANPTGAANGESGENGKAATASTKGKLVRSPNSGMYVTEDHFRETYHRAPRPEEYEK